MHFLVKMKICKLYKNWHMKSHSCTPPMGAPWQPHFLSKYPDNHTAQPQIPTRYQVKDPLLHPWPKNPAFYLSAYPNYRKWVPPPIPTRNPHWARLQPMITKMSQCMTIVRVQKPQSKRTRSRQQEKNTKKTAALTTMATQQLKRRSNLRKITFRYHCHSTTWSWKKHYKIMITHTSSGHHCTFQSQKTQ